ncbi:LacI family transcriptional regulator [Labedella populi]|uniref:LacI family transcriptional regulator n=1 Tax=Labedella populi TaxID=2498850 RepID=A0A3S3ZWS6_9MICO|nr:substrate-binding domain-containing protein [Labedella populi]RWZ64571.1 LacI family transcriptional regulator [Labedella populi]
MSEREVRAIGLAIPASRIDDRFVVALLNALPDPLIRDGVTLVTKVVRDDDEERRLYEHWAQVGGVSGVALLGVRPDDARIVRLRTLGFPIAAVIDSSVEADFPAVVVDFDAAIDVLRTFLAERPARRTLYISAVEEGSTTSARTVAAENAALGGLFEVVYVEHSVDAATAAASTAVADGPATLVFDSDVHAAAALSMFRSQGLEVPKDVSIVSWTNSALCQSASRSITAIDRRGSEIGVLLGERILGAIAGDDRTHDRAPRPFVVVGETA